MSRAGGWSSIEASAPLAERLPGHGRLEVEAWLSQQIDRTHDSAFAALFAEPSRVLGMDQASFLHRVVKLGAMRLIGGIRFFGGDTARPFVELLAWDGPCWPSPEEWSRLRDAVAREWGAFRPAALRVFHPSALPAPEDACLDQSVHAAPYAAMSTDASPSGVGFPMIGDDALPHALVAGRYGELQEQDAELRRDLAAIEEDHLRALGADGQVMGIEWAGEAVGLLAWEAGAVEWMRGDVVAEEVVLRRAAGCGLAAAAQRELARRRRRTAPDTLLIGTIHRRNTASRRTAERAGRPEVARYSFVPISRAGP